MITRAMPAPKKTGIAVDGTRSLPFGFGCGKAPPERSRQSSNILSMLSAMQKRRERNMCFLKNNA